MACFHPFTAYRCDNGDVVFHEKSRFKISHPFSLPCGQCIGCRLERSRQWAMRCLHESSLHEDNHFLTLTYDDDHLPEGQTLRYRDFQLFMKRLRKISPKLRFFMCGEYGDKLGRPHYHAIMFNLPIDDLKYYSKTGSGSKIHTSEKLTKLWGMGEVFIGDVTFESAAYVARYCLKKVTGKDSEEFYKRLDTSTGEIISIEPEFAHMSLKPGIGRPWLDRFGSDVYPHDYVIIRGQKVKPPKYYDRVFEQGNPDDLDYIKAQRELDAALNMPDNSRARLAVKEEVKRASISTLQRS